ncbi:hypothetical protein FJ364_04235, partial [Candidatus Dependentiae bacterium]|nr:hypothetical protein [Candidatus Dependentiae bacterium]
MKNTLKILSLSFIAVANMLYAADGNGAKKTSLQFNMPVTLINGDRVVWVHNQSRLLKKYDTSKPTENIPVDTAAPDDHFELLASKADTEARAKEGANVFLLQKASDPSATGDIKNGDDIRIVAIYAAGGYKEKEGHLAKGRIINVENTSRQGEHKLSKALSHYDVYVSDPDYTKDDQDKATFSIENIKSKKGDPVLSTEAIILQNKEYTRPLSLIPESRFGDKFAEINAVKMKELDTSTHFTIRLVDIDKDLTDEGRAHLKKTLSEILKSSLLKLAPQNKPGNSPFQFVPVLHGGRLRALFDSTWRLAEASNGYTIFDVNPAGGSIMVVFSPAQKSDEEAYVVIIGDEKNTKTKLIKGEKELLVLDGTKTPSAIFGDLSSVHSFWAKIDGTHFTVGKGRIVGENEFLKYDEEDSESALQSFVGFAGSESALFSNIVVSSKEYLAKMKAEEEAKDKKAKEAAIAHQKAAQDKASVAVKTAATKPEE